MPHKLGAGVFIADDGVVTVDLDQVAAYLGIELTEEEARGLYPELAALIREQCGPIPVELLETDAAGEGLSCTILDPWEKGNGGGPFSRN
jgi:hypothetical protein